MNHSIPVNGVASDPPRISLLTRIRSAIVLPKEITAFERSYLKRMNRIALWFFCAHLPAFMVVAWANGTGVLPVTLMTLAVLAVPVIGSRVLTSPRNQSYVFGFTSMCMGGVLVHAGQGPVQIEMHFYFFSVLAMLALFANPMTVIVAAATVAVHHLVLWAVAPASIFNYSAPIWVVLVHAGFVVLETVAACFIARNFFDNVIGLEAKVESRTQELAVRNREMQVVLDSIQQGIVTVDARGALQAEHSASIVDFFGPFEPGESFADLLSRSCTTTAQWFSMSWTSVEDGFLPLELALDQLPKSAKVGDKHYTFQYQAKVLADEELDSLLIVVSDITGDRARERAEALQKELQTVFENVLQDKARFARFHDNAQGLLDSASHGTGAPTDAQKRDLHTLKGNSAAFGLHSIAAHSHRAEDAWAGENWTQAQSELCALRERWDELSHTVDKLTGGQDLHGISVSESQAANLLRLAVDSGHAELGVAAAELFLEPTSTTLDRLAQEAAQLAEDLQRGPLNIHVHSHDVRLNAKALDPFWCSMTHLIRNAVDHGLQPEDAPTSAEEGWKPALSLTSEIHGNQVIIAVEDNGRGIDWDAVRHKAASKGMPTDTHSDLVHALFSPGLSTRDEVTEHSGRGVGLGAVAQATEALGGKIQVTSAPGEGTRMQFEFSLDALSSTPKSATSESQPRAADP